MNSLAGLAKRFRLEVGEDVHSRGIEPDEERLARLGVGIDELHRGAEELLVDCWHALGRERPGILDPLRAVGIGPGMEDAARTKSFPELRILRIEIAFRLFLGI